MNDKKRQAIIKAITQAKNSQLGVTAIKVELEAQLERRGDWSETTVCQDFMMQVFEEAGWAIPSEYNGYDTHNGNYAEWELSGPLTYAEFYFDGSVDSEFTFTLMLDNPTTVFVIPRVIERFNELAQQNGNGMDVRGAGMHMAFLSDRNGSYPGESRGYTTERFTNFRRSMMLLMPALYFLGASCENTRGLHYRRPEVGRDTHRAAIDYRHGALEFRVFDTCYSTPETILDNIVVMCNSMQYWSSSYKPSGAEKVTTRVAFGVNSGSALDRFYTTNTHIELLNNGLTKLKPSYYTIREIKLQRKFNRTRRGFVKLLEEQRKQAEASYKEYEERFTWQLEEYRGNYYANSAQDVRYEAAHSGGNMTIEQAKREIKRRVDRQIKNRIARKVTKDNHVARELERLQGNNGEFILAA